MSPTVRLSSGFQFLPLWELPNSHPGKHGFDGTLKIRALTLLLKVESGFEIRSFLLLVESVFVVSILIFKALLVY